MSEYHQQAEDFLKAIATEFSIVYLYTAPYFPDDKESRDVYQFTLKNARGMYSAKFGDSIRNTERRIFASVLQPMFSVDRKVAAKLGFSIKIKDVLREEIIAVRHRKPHAYDVLAGLTMYNGESFANFCAEFDYDTDSRKALGVYEAVQQEYDGVCKVFTPEQREQLAEIQ